MKIFDFEDVVMFVALIALMLTIGFIMSLPILIAIAENNLFYLLIYPAYVVAVYIAYLIKRSV